MTSFERARDMAAAEEMPADPVLYHNLGTLYARTDEYNKAVDHLETARALNEEDDNWSELASNYFMLASIASRRENYDSAREHALRALEYDKASGEQPRHRRRPECTGEDQRAAGTV